VGLHTGKRVSIKLNPAPPDHGVVFSGRNGTGARHALKVTPAAVVGCDHNTTLGEGSWEVRTVEHLLSTLHGMGIDNVEIEVDGHEVPIMDGSAAPFIHLIHLAGIKDQPRPKRYLRVTKTVRVEEKGRWVSLEPSPNPMVTFTLQFDHPVMGVQSRSFPVTPGSFTRDIAAARTFGFLHELESLQGRGLALGASMENAVAIDRYRILNREGLRFADEFVRHKILDVLGDLYLAGMPVIGHYRGHRAGHLLNYRLIQALVNDPASFEEIDGLGNPAVAASA
jgi:UDP-3-O-[3-hydroxymyristoyl] N-acetylglucosamine deacetylase